MFRYRASPRALLNNSAIISPPASAAASRTGAASCPARPPAPASPRLPLAPSGTAGRRFALRQRPQPDGVPRSAAPTPWQRGDRRRQRSCAQRSGAERNGTERSGARLRLPPSSRGARALPQLRSPPAPPSLPSRAPPPRLWERPRGAPRAPTAPACGPAPRRPSRPAPPRAPAAELGPLPLRPRGSGWGGPCPAASWAQPELISLPLCSLFHFPVPFSFLFDFFPFLFPFALSLFSLLAFPVFVFLVFPFPPPFFHFTRPCRLGQSSSKEKGSTSIGDGCQSRGLHTCPQPAVYQCEHP